MSPIQTEQQGEDWGFKRLRENEQVRMQEEKKKRRLIIILNARRRREYLRYGCVEERDLTVASYSGLPK